MAFNFSDTFQNIRNWNDSSRNMAKEAWDRLHTLPQGKQLFSYLVGRHAPYTGNIKAKIEELTLGHSKVSMLDQPSVRNHLRSIHAVALTNLAELTGNIALSYSMAADARFIVSKMEIEFVKKARGPLTATCTCPIPSSNEKKTYLVPVEIWNAAGELVSRATLHSLVGPKHSR